MTTKTTIKTTTKTTITTITKTRMKSTTKTIFWGRGGIFTVLVLLSAHFKRLPDILYAWFLS